MILSSEICIEWPTLHLDVAFDVGAGGTIAIMGPNGAGKSTIVRCLAGLTPIHSGRIRWNDTVWDEPSHETFIAPGGRQVGLVFQDHVLFPHLTALDNVAFGPRARGYSRRDARRSAADCLERLGLSDLAQARPMHLSGGQSQRVALARALVHPPNLLLLDEPLASLDVVTRRRIRHEIAQDLHASATMTILVTHDPEDARSLASDVIVIEDGRIAQRGTPDELSRSPATPYVAELFGI